MIAPIIILLGLGVVFYFLSYLSPKTDLMMYTVAATFFLMAGIAGLMGYTIQTGETISYSYTTINNQTVIANEVHTPIYGETFLFKTGLPMLGVLLTLYMIMILSVENGRGSDSKPKS